MTSDVTTQDEIVIPARDVELPGVLTLLESARGLVLFVHGSGSSRFSPRNRFVAKQLNDAGFGTLLFDLLTAAEEDLDARTAELRFDIGLLSSRVVDAIDWMKERRETQPFRLGLFGASTGAAAALVAAAERPDAVGAIVSRGGRPDLAGDALPRVKAPTLLIVGGNDYLVIELNNQAAALLRTQNEISIMSGASHLFEERGRIEAVSNLARDWFIRYL